MGINNYYFKNQKREIDNFDYNKNKNINIYDINKYICKIYIDKEIKGIGFFCYIPLSGKSSLIPSLITNNFLINKKDKIHLIFNNNNEDIKIIGINDDRKIYQSVKYDTTIIEIKPKKDKIENFLELDGNINKENSNKIYEGKSIYIIECPISNNLKNISFSFGKLKKISEINKFDLYHLCSSKKSFPGSPILLKNNKVIGIQKESSSNFYDFNKGTFLKYPIKEFINKGKINEILITLKIEEEDINKNIYYINNLDYNNKEGQKIELFINNKKHNYQKYFKPKENGLYLVKLKLNFRVKNCYKMFYKCNNIISIDLSFFDSSIVSNTNYMFSYCHNLLYINLSNFETFNVTNMGYMFSHCYNLINIDLSSFNTENVNDISNMFYNCCKITNLNLSNFNTEKVINMSKTFFNCRNLKNVDLSSFNTKNVIDMSYMFSYCKKLDKINLLTFNTEKVTDMNHMFSYCYNLTNINLSMFDTENVTDISFMFSFCNNLTYIDISTFDTKNIRFMNKLFFNCSNLTSVNFPSFNPKNLRNMSLMFYNCYNLTIINNDCFNFKNVMKNIFLGCINLFNID